MSDVSLAELAGHDRDAMLLVDELVERYRREGLAGLRASVEARTLQAEGMPPARDFRTVALVVEAMLQIAESRAARGGSRRDWEDFDREEQRGDDEREARGGGA